MMILQIYGKREDCVSLDLSLVILLAPYRRRRVGAYELSYIQRVSDAVVVVVVVVLEDAVGDSYG